MTAEYLDPEVFPSITQKLLKKESRRAADVRANAARRLSETSLPKKVQSLVSDHKNVEEIIAVFPDDYHQIFERKITGKKVELIFEMYRRLQCMARNFDKVLNGIEMAGKDDLDLMEMVQEAVVEQDRIKEHIREMVRRCDLLVQRTQD